MPINALPGYNMHSRVSNASMISLYGKTVSRSVLKKYGEAACSAPSSGSPSAGATTGDHAQLSASALLANGEAAPAPSLRDTFAAGCARAGVIAACRSVTLSKRRAFVPAEAAHEVGAGA